jgi:hypothetical protein
LCSNKEKVTLQNREKREILERKDMGKGKGRGDVRGAADFLGKGSRK